MNYSYVFCIPMFFTLCPSAFNLFITLSNPGANSGWYRSYNSAGVNPIELHPGNVSISILTSAFCSSLIHHPFTLHSSKSFFGYVLFSFPKATYGLGLDRL